ncbi:multidrug ABC transporter permease [Roseospira marina]|uniref:Transport permease protein n=1 Tax=Roseospira marina TaxID=140057 RepID=A0A5M6IBA3_9PROT|nr:ABC transporter permease [Roseospira marina]KAA5604898.1 multidrug ABC transporter permease [Roseospira marina]MBB4315237.1 ABC-2 type transport system permease protein [Roseospira marina]MBB5088237.1 ABC-2 type transport system permease protein [Roseospira marina]
MTVAGKAPVHGGPETTLSRANDASLDESEAPPRASLWAVGAALARREFTRFIRQPTRVIGSIGQPLIFWVLLGAGLTPSFSAPGMEGMTYLEYFYPGVLMMMILFASVFASITIIEDRDQGFLQGVLVAPVPRLGIVLGKVGGASLVALFQTAILLVAAPFIGLSVSIGGAVLLAITLVLIALGFTGLGFLFAWPMKSTAGFHAMMMVIMMPMWVLSGAFFPITGVPSWLHWIMMINPVTHAMTILRAPFYADPLTLFGQGSYLIALAVVIVWVVGCLSLAAARVSARDKGIVQSAP